MQEEHAVGSPEIGKPAMTVHDNGGEKQPEPAPAETPKPAEPEPKPAEEKPAEEQK
jgi:hypothetical protein